MGNKIAYTYNKTLRNYSPIHSDSPTIKAKISITRIHSLSVPNPSNLLDN